MKFCSRCGKELFDEAVVCVGCGCAVPNNNHMVQTPIFNERKTKFCAHCGKEIDQDAVVCLGCGCSVSNQEYYPAPEVVNNFDIYEKVSPSGLKTASIILIRIFITLRAIAAIILIGYLLALHTGDPELLPLGYLFLYFLPSLAMTIVPLAWSIPMGIILVRKTRNGEPISTGFKVCILLFVDLIAGILLLCDKD
jgi:hypothetical protein